MKTYLESLQVETDTTLAGKVNSLSVVDTTAGASVTLATPTKKVVRLTGAVTSINMIPAGSEFQDLVLVNSTGADITINHLTGATTANQINTGGSAMTFKNLAAMSLTYNSATSKWVIMSAAGSFNPPAVVFRAHSNGGTAVAALGNIPFTTRVVDTVNGWNITTFDRFTIPAGYAGYYDIDVSIRMSTGLQMQLYVYINGSSYASRLNEGASISASVTFLGIYLNVGDIVTIRPASAITLVSDAGFHRISIVRRNI